jgi:hypothetical protein|tara:strand:+ start:2022 stop:2456 length:435 start_codon:yes stop_codon:yes gene_type:complete
MKYIGYTQEEAAEKWARQHLGAKGAPSLFRALSTVHDDGTFACVILLTNFTERNIDINIAADCIFTPKISVQLFNGAFKMIFEELGASRTTGLIADTNILSQRFAEQIGFVKEGTMRKAYDQDEDVHIYGFLNDEFKTHNWYRS